MPDTPEGIRKAHHFLAVIESALTLKAEIQAESTTLPRHIEAAQAIDDFIAKLMTLAAGDK